MDCNSNDQEEGNGGGGGGVLGSGPQLCQFVPEGLPETEPGLCSVIFESSASV